jgi:hypothetical protein
VLVCTTSLLSFSDSHDLLVEWNLQLARSPSWVKSPTRTISWSSEISDSHDLQVVRISDSPDLFCSRSRSRSAGFWFVRPLGRQASDSYDLLVGRLLICTTSWSAGFRFVWPLGRQASDSYDLLVGRLPFRTTSWSACFRPVRPLGRQDYRPTRPLLFEVDFSFQELVTFLF